VRDRCLEEYTILSSLNPVHVRMVCACFVSQTLQRQIEAGAFAVLAVVGDSHDAS